jgi:hypothetical protein
MSRRQQNAIFLRDGICKCYDCEQLDDSCLRQGTLLISNWMVKDVSVRKFF